MNEQSAPIPDLCLRYIREVKKAQKEARPVDPRPWFKNLKRRGVNIDPMVESTIIGHDNIANLLESIKKEYAMYG